MGNDRPIEPANVSQLVESFVRDEYDGAVKYSNKEILDDSGIFDLHTLAGRIYALGFNEGRGVEDMQSRERRLRKRNSEVA